MSRNLRIVVQATTINGNQIVQAFGLMSLVVFIYTLYAYYFAIDSFFNDSFGESGENMCTSVRHCFFTILSLGPRSSGSIGDMLIRQSYLPGNKNKFYSRWVYDLTVFILVNVIGMNIVFGIVIQTFAQMREQLTQNMQNMENVCFICSLERSKIEKSLGEFEKHILIDHNQWNYIYFMYYLRKTVKSDYNGIEGDIANKINKDDFFWLPIGKYIGQEDLDDNEDAEEKIEISYRLLSEVAHENEAIRISNKENEENN